MLEQMSVAAKVAIQDCTAAALAGTPPAAEHSSASGAGVLAIAGATVSRTVSVEEQVAGVLLESFAVHTTAVPVPGVHPEG